MPEEIDLTHDRVTRENAQHMLFDLPPDWREVWWGMPDFAMEDARAQRRIVVNFMCEEDVTAFTEATGARITDRTESMWYPPQKALGYEYEYDGPKTDSIYPICIPSKGRADVQKTGRALKRMGVNYRFFVEQTEAEEYAKHVGEEHVVSMPFNDLGKGSIPARNFIWLWALEQGYKRHWTVDDNIISFVRTHANRRLCVRGGGFFPAMENFVDRYENIVMAGPHDRGFVPDREPNTVPYLFNSRVYSCILLDTSLATRWRGRYNEDTDLSLRLLKEGRCTLLFRAFCMNKGVTNKGDGKSQGALKGGNTDNVYGEDADFRRKFADSLKEQHPDVVEVTWKFGRWHHQVDYSGFKKNKPVMRATVTPTAVADNYEMKLVRVEKKG